MLRTLLAGLPAVFLLACTANASVTVPIPVIQGDAGPPPPPAPTQISQDGDLGQGIFTYICDSPSDPFCNSLNGFPTNAIPSIAVGASFMLKFQETFPTDSVAPGRITSFTEPDGRTGLRIAVPGFSAIFGRFVAGDVTPADFLHLTAARPDRLTITAVQNPVGFRAVVLAKDGSQLAGSFPCTWTSSDPTIAKITSDPHSNIVTFQPGNPGTAQLHLEIDIAPTTPLTQDVPVTVH